MRKKKKKKIKRKVGRKKTARKSKKKRAVKGAKKRVAKGKEKPARKTSIPAGASLEEVGVITHYFPRVDAAVLKLTKGPLLQGDTIIIKGHTTDFKEKVKSKSNIKKSIRAFEDIWIDMLRESKKNDRRKKV